MRKAERMNNRYIFRGKRKDNEEWIEGYCVCNGEHCYIFSGKLGIITINWVPYEVIPETIGQCTTLTDKNGKLIFTGDVLHIKTGKGWTCPVGTDIYYKVVFTEFNEQCNSCTEYIGFMAECSSGSLSSIYYIITNYGAEVIGNVHDNKELLEVQK